MNRRVGDREGPDAQADDDVRAERWTEIKGLLEGALEQPPAARETWLADAAGGDTALFDEVAALLALETEMGDFLEQPVFDLHDEPRDGGGRAGEAVGAYRLQREIGRGGMGIVYVAERDDQEYTKTVAVKVLKRGLDTDDVISRFRAERQILAGLEHPNIARLIEGGTTTADHLPYFVLEHVDGRPIDLFCDEEELDVVDRLRLFLVVCGAVAAAHRNLVVHRDLKPSNILVTDDGTPKLLDFGIAKLLGPAEVEAPLTRQGRFLLTPEYASPEQVWGQPINTTTDVYSLGVLLFQLLTGRRPFEFPEPDLHLVGRRLREEEAPKPSSVVPRDLARRLAGDLDDIVGMALRKEPDRRYGSVEALAEDVRRHLAGLPVRAVPDSLAYRTRKFLRRHRAGVAAAGTILGLVVGFAVVVTVLMGEAVRERERSEDLRAFLIEMIRAPDPDRANGEEVTVLEMLELGEKRFLGGFEDDPQLDGDFHHMFGDLYVGLGQYERARPLAEKALDIRQRVHGEQSLPVAETLHVLAEIDLRTQSIEASQIKVERAVEIQRQLGGRQAESYLHALNNLAMSKKEGGEYAAAESLHLEILEAKRRRYPADHPEIANTLHNLAVLYHDQGNPVRAIPLFDEALRIRRRGSRPDAEVSDEDLTKTLNSYATSLEEVGQTARAVTLYEEALAIRRRVLPDKHPGLISALSNLALVRLAAGEIEQADSLLSEARDLPTNPSNAGVLTRNHAEVRMAQGRFEEAEAMLREALTQYRSHPQTLPWRIADAESLLGSLLARAGRDRDAENLLLRAYPVIAEAKGRQTRPTREALERIVDFYVAAGDETRAAQFRALRQPPLSLSAGD